MVSLYDCTEPTIISEELLQKSVEEQRPDGEAGRIALQDGIKFAEAKMLVLSYKGILQIENLWNFTNLQRLNLDNNLIEKISGLDFLVTLKWLDLSFNNIEVINGLNNLLNLEDLSVFNNRIKKLENIGNLQKLQVLSVGNNKLDDLDNLIIVRKLKNVKTLIASGNPLSTNASYRLYVAAMIPEVVYLDYQLIDEESRTLGAAKYSIQLDALNGKDKAEQIRLAEKEIEDANDKLYQAASVNFLHSTVLLDSLIQNDKDVALCLLVDGAERIFQQFKENLLSICKESFDAGLIDYYKRKNEVDAFNEAVKIATEKNQLRAVELVDRYNDSKSDLVNELYYMADMYRATEPEDEMKMNEFESKLSNIIGESDQLIKNLDGHLMENELYLSDQVEEQLKEFERFLVEMTQNAMENVRNVATSIRDQETRFHEQLADISLFYMDKVLKDEEVLPEQMKELFADKDTVMAALSGSHDTRTNKIDRIEDKIALGIKGWTDTRLDDMRNDEIKRNRDRILEIIHFIDCQRAEMDENEAALREIVTPADK